MVERGYRLKRSASLPYAATVTRIAIAAAIVGGCADTALSSGPSAEPFLYLVISSEPIPARFPSPSDTAILSLLLTAGSAAGAPFRSAQQFALTDETDGTTFTFAERVPASAIPGVGRNGATLEDGNFLLPYSSSATSLGASALRPLGTYDLRVETEGRVITGRVLIPDRPQPSIAQEGTQRFVTFPDVSGAAAYLVGGDTELYRYVTTRNKIQLLYDVDPAIVRPNPEFRVVALDSNLVRYISDSTQIRAGIEGGLGLFGAINSASIPVPWP
jgi:hypothetical protein